MAWQAVKGPISSPPAHDAAARHSCSRRGTSKRRWANVRPPLLTIPRERLCIDLSLLATQHEGGGWLFGQPLHPPCQPLHLPPCCATPISRRGSAESLPVVTVPTPTTTTVARSAARRCAATPSGVFIPLAKRKSENWRLPQRQRGVLKQRHGAFETKGKTAAARHPCRI